MAHSKFSKVQTLLKDKISNSDITFDEIGHKVGASRMTIWRALKSEAPRKFRLKQISDCLNIDLREHFEDDFIKDLYENIDIKNSISEANYKVQYRDLLESYRLLELEFSAYKKKNPLAS